MAAEAKTADRIRFQSQTLFPALAFLALTAALLAFPEEVKSGVEKSLLYCLTVLTPSLFPFMALTSFAVTSGAGETIGRYLGLLPRYVFRLPAVCAAPILMSFIGGYPAGAKGASLLLREGKISRAQAGRMMLFCVNPGVAFVVTFLGGGLLHSFRAGWLLFFSVTLSGILLGFLSGFGSPVPEKDPPSANPPPGSAVIRSATDASKSVLSMCACIILFAGFTALLRGSGAYALLCRSLTAFTPLRAEQAGVLLSFLLEVTGGVGDAVQFQASAGFYAFGLAFGGLCVHLQVFSLFQAFPIRKWKFFLFRFLHGVLAVFCYLFLTRLFPYSPVEEALAPHGLSTTAQQVSPLSGTLAGGLSLLLMCVAFLLIVAKGASDSAETP